MKQLPTTGNVNQYRCPLLDINSPDCPRKTVALDISVNWSLSLNILKHLFVRTRKPVAENLTVTSKLKPVTQGRRRVQEAFGMVW